MRNYKEALEEAKKLSKKVIISIAAAQNPDVYKV